MDVPVTAEFVATANHAQFHDECRGANAEWPARFVDTGEGWVYRIDVDGVAVETIEAAIVSHVPRQAPFDEIGRILTYLCLYEGAQLPPASETVKMRDGLTVEQCATEFYAWLEAGGS